MKNYVANIEQLSLGNKYFRNVLFTDAHVQLVVMALKPGEDIGEEVHELDQFIRVEKGNGMAILDGAEYALTAGSAVIVSQGTLHNIINTGTKTMKIYTLYAPPNHKEGTKQETKPKNEHKVLKKK